ncbi:MarR family winged helix-turn-helix transcriptional regulator [Kurthia sibirica]|uniref:RNA polymerase subunit sigma n=1 Tax=Kurthia sibirica TaxID=202750 RepID=A0A2U3APS9_9BACL|nr:MarR family transcriptional regulator [Kurthia sibirica]PWI26541.1 RNA polymerase subunit sigma [Kurthia sibirica]GEK32788.1 hypothetical protein KSI01_03210 [Kurthia sibirica]
MNNEGKERSITSLFEIAASLERKWANEWNSHNNIGLSKTHILLLDLLDSNGPTRPSELAEKLHVTTGGVTVLTTKLIKAGAIQKTKNEADRRAFQLAITEEGAKQLEHAYDHIDHMVHRMFGMLSEEELESLRKIFAKLLLG